MDFVTKHWTYIEQCASCRAIEIAEITGRFCDIDDFRQEILIWVTRRAHSYSPQRAMPTTFISMTSQTGKKRILRALWRKKNRIISNAIPIPQN